MKSWMFRYVPSCVRARFAVHVLPTGAHASRRPQRFLPPAMSLPRKGETHDVQSRTRKTTPVLVLAYMVLQLQYSSSTPPVKREVPAGAAA